VKNRERTHSQLKKTPRAFLQSRQCGRLSPLDWAAGLKSAQYYSPVFPFLFIPELKQLQKMVENPKIVKPVFLDFLFSLEFNKNSFMIFRGNKEF
jgi:hypothetical protein